MHFNNISPPFYSKKLQGSSLKCQLFLSCILWFSFFLLPQICCCQHHHDTVCCQAYGKLKKEKTKKIKRRKKKGISIHSLGKILPALEAEKAARNISSAKDKRLECQSGGRKPAGSGSRGINPAPRVNNQLGRFPNPVVIYRFHLVPINASAEMRYTKHEQAHAEQVSSCARQAKPLAPLQTLFQLPPQILRVLLHPSPEDSLFETYQPAVTQKVTKPSSSQVWSHLVWAGLIRKEQLHPVLTH